MLWPAEDRGNHGGKVGAHGAERPAKKAAGEEARRALPAKRARRPQSRRSLRAGMVEAALAAFAHEVRTPLTGILAISDLLATSDLGERERRWVDTIKAGAEHLASLATLFVDAAQRRSGAERAAGLCSTCARWRAAPAIRSPAARRPRACRPRSKFRKSCRRFVVGDPVRLRAALENLIDNAVKFTEQGGVALRADAAAQRERARSASPLRFPTAASG